MNRLAKWLIHLYPRAWRERYRSELEALVDDSNARWYDAFDVLKAAALMHFRRWPAIVASCAAAGALAGFGVSFLLPQVYISRASIGVRAPAGAAETILPTLESAMSRQSLADILRAQNLYTKDLLRKPIEDVAHTMREDVRLVARPKSNSLEISFAYGDRSKARSTTAALVANIMEANLHAHLSAPERAHLPQITLELTEAPDLPRSPVNRYIVQGTLVGLTAGVLLGSLIAFARRQRACA